MKFRPSVENLESIITMDGSFVGPVMLPSTSPTSAPPVQVYSPDTPFHLGTGGRMMLAPTDPASAPSGPTSTTAPVGDFQPPNSSTMTV